VLTADMRWIFAASCLFVLVACSSGPSGSATNEDDLRVDSKVARLVDRAQCAQGNSVHETLRFRPATFDPAAALAEMKRDDRERGCPGRVYSTSKESGAKAFETFLMTDQAEGFDDQCSSSDEGIDAPALRRELAALANDPANKGVFSSLHDDTKSDDPVHCALFRFHVYRADGTLAKFDFDWSD
jgi:hypothetical protein